MRLGASRQTCRISDANDAVDCTAFLSDVEIPDNFGLAPKSARPTADDRLSAWRSWRDRLYGALRSVGGVEPREDVQGALARIADAKVVTHVDVTDASSGSTEIKMNSVDLLGGLVHVDSLVQRYSAASDGMAGTAAGTTIAEGVSIAGIPVRIDADGVKLNEQAFKKGDIEATTKGLQEALAEGGLTLRAAAQRNTTSGPTGSIEGEGLFVRGQVVNGGTTYFLNFWLGNGKVEATRDAASTNDVASDGAASESSDAMSTMRAASGRHSSATPESLVPAIPHPSLGSDVTGAIEASRLQTPVSSAEPVRSQSVTAEREWASPFQPMPVASVKQTQGGLSRRALISLLGAWQFLGVAAVAAAALRTCKRREARGSA
ncbi:MAG: hypothetical protein AB1679_12690 [Actinomycetota bacterium]